MGFLNCYGSFASKFTHKEYLQRSTRQKAGAFILLTAGAITLATVSQGNTPLNAVPTLAVTGTIMTLGSIPLFIAAHRNKKRAMELSASMGLKKRTIFTKHNPTWAFSPALSIKVKL